MKYARHTKRALAASAASVFLCAALLAGTTLAWFTDSVTNTGNAIQAGTLEIGLDTGSETKLFGSDDTFLWEPGRSQKAGVTVTNEGSLWLKYALGFANVTVADGVDPAADITKVLDVYKVDKAAENVAASDLITDNFLGTMKDLMAGGSLGVKAEGVLAPKGYAGADGSDSGTFTLVVKMQESADNAYQGAGVTFDVVVKATQYTYETDGFGSNQYDAGATLDFVPVNTAADLSAAVAAGEPVLLEDNITLTEKLVATGDVTIIGDGHSITTPSGVDRVIDVSNLTEPATISLTGVDLVGPTTGTYTRGISLYNNTQPVTLVLDDCSVSANYYALNVASANENVKVVVKNSQLTGWCAFQTHSPNADITFENCTLTGLNDKGYNADGWNDFATIVINAYSEGNPDPDGAHDCTLTFKNCRIEATQTTGNRQFLLSVGAMGTVLNVENCTFFIDGEQIPSTLEAVAPHIGVSSEEIGENLVVNFK